ncbi:MAG: 4-(cytidine 5'-diphospho)-2-C-methyl-D-erythritol kinase [Chakrabartia sp.]
MTVEINDTGYAKINLALHVRAQRADGYHRLETLFAFAEDGDQLSAQLAPDFSLQITGPFAAHLLPDADNLVLRAARLLAHSIGVSGGLAFTLEKRLPIAAGIGGGSADAAAALRLAAQLWGVATETKVLHDIAVQIGADVPSCLPSQSCFGTGTGTELTPVDAGLAGTPILLVNPCQPCPTGPVFKAWDGVDHGPLAPMDWQNGRNDLEAPAQALVPSIGDVLAQLRAQPGLCLARMSGSGATCFGVWASLDDRDRAASAIQTAHPNWWIMASRLR